DLLGRGLPGLDPLFRGLSCRCLRDLLARGAAALGGDLSLGRGFLARASRLRSSLLPGRFLLRHRPPPPNLGKRRHYSILRTPCHAVSPVAAVSRSHAASAPMTATSSSPKAAPPPTAGESSTTATGLASSSGRGGWARSSRPPTSPPGPPSQSSS